MHSRFLLFHLSKLARKRTMDDPFDSIMPHGNAGQSSPQQDGLVIILCKDEARKLTIKGIGFK